LLSLISPFTHLMSLGSIYSILNNLKGSVRAWTMFSENLNGLSGSASYEHALSVEKDDHYPKYNCSYSACIICLSLLLDGFFLRSISLIEISLEGMSFHFDPCAF
jgi:hypothetical protein